MPLTQARMLAVLTEALDAADAHNTLRSDLYVALASNVPDSRKLDVIMHLLDNSTAPRFLALCQQERDHIARTRQRNQRAAKRMRDYRTRRPARRD